MGKEPVGDYMSGSSKFRFLCIVDLFSEVKQKVMKQYIKGDAALVSGYGSPKCVMEDCRNR